ncbi:MAG: hypothetical protein ACWA5R_13735 [bacterium]
MQLQQRKHSIEQQIQAAKAAEGAVADLRAVLECHVEDVAECEQAIDEAEQFCIRYIEQVPYWMTVAEAAAREVGIEAAMQDILDASLSYWEDEDDVITDRMGLLGIMDDAYFSLTLLQSVSEHYRLQTGKFLFPSDLAKVNKTVRHILGEPYNLELDSIVSAKLKTAELTKAMVHVTDRAKQHALETRQTIWGHDPVVTETATELEALHPSVRETIQDI